MTKKTTLFDLLTKNDYFVKGVEQAKYNIPMDYKEKIYKCEVTWTKENIQNEETKKQNTHFYVLCNAPNQKNFTGIFSEAITMETNDDIEYQGTEFEVFHPKNDKTIEEGKRIFMNEILPQLKKSLPSAISEYLTTVYKSE